MKEEVLAAVEFLIRFTEKSKSFPREQLENFKDILASILMKRFEKHWFPEIPARGQGYRCIRMNPLNPVDESIEIAANRCGFSYKDLSLPTELTLWVDPSEVCYRLGESEGSYCTLATFPSSETSSESSWSNASSPLSSPPCSPTHDKSLYSPMATNKSQTAVAYSLQQQQRVTGLNDHLVYGYQQQQHTGPYILNPNLMSSLPLQHNRKPLVRNTSFNNYQNQRLPWRCDLTFPIAANTNRTTMLRNYNGYNNRQYKNVVKV